MTAVSASLAASTRRVLSPPQSTLTRQKLLIALLTPLLWWLAGQSWGGFALGWIALAPLFFALHNLPPRARWKLGYAVGWTSFAMINWWIVPTIARGGPVIGLPVMAGAALGVVAVALIAAVHGLGVSLIALLWNTRHPLAQRFSWLFPVIVAIAWIVFDWARGLGPLAHMWGAPAYTQWRDLALLQNAAWLGQHGLSALCVWFAASLALWMARPDGAARPVLWRAPVLVFALLHLWGAWQLSRPAPSRTLRVLLIQTAIPALRKNQGGGETPLQQAQRLTREHFARREYSAPIDLIVWPESVLNFRRFGASKTPSGLEWTEVAALSREVKTPILSGGLSRALGSTGEEILNEATLAMPDGRVAGSSSKVRLVPFGERAVGGELWPWLNRLAPDPPISRATGVRTLRLQTGESTLSIGSAICFESCFPSPSTQLRKDGAQALFVLTNDAWFDGTEAPWQHAAMAAIRAAENRVPVAQSANGGYAVAVDARGRFTAIGEYNKPQALLVEMKLE